MWRRDMRWIVRPIIVLACLAMLPGCGKSPRPVPATTDPSTTETADAASPPSSASSGATTQQILAGPFADILLAPLPLKAKAPRSWSVETIRDTDITLLRGTGPGGIQIRIQLSVLTSMQPRRVELILQAAQRDAKKDPTTLSCDVRHTTEMQTLEIQKTTSAPTTPADQPIDWTITYFVQHDLNYDAYSMSVIGMTRSQYDQSKELLRKIIDSITYAPLRV